VGEHRRDGSLEPCPLLEPPARLSEQRHLSAHTWPASVGS
jgi:hypothetical protein